MDEIMKKRNYILDKPHKKIWGLNQIGIGESICGVPTASHYISKNSNDFVLLKLDYGHAICNIYFLIFSFPIQKILNSKFHNSFELVRFYREMTGEGIDEGINQVHNINWEEIIEFLNSLQTLKIQVVSKDMSGFKNIKFVSFTNNSLAEEVDFQKWIL